MFLTRGRTGVVADLVMYAAHGKLCLSGSGGLR